MVTARGVSESDGDSKGSESDGDSKDATKQIGDT